MDTGTHVVMGIALGGLATLDPVVANDPVMKQAVMIAAIVGSQAPDFDTVLKLRNNAVYIRNHRGITHSIPALFLWPLLISGSLLLFFPEASFATLLLWSFIAVFLHVFVDIFNAYGTQALRPITKRWVALGVINIFDPFIFFTHLGAIFLWQLGLGPAEAFISLYVLLVFYYIWRIKSKRNVVKLARRQFPIASHIFVSPTLKWTHWHVVIRTPDMLYVAKASDSQLQLYEQYPFEPIPETKILKAAKKDENLSAFLSFSPTYRWVIKETDDMIEVRFYDLRYRSKGHYPFIAIVQLDHNLSILSSYTGWVYSEETLQKKLDVVTHT
ncbi:metal-dependent hydrolase [Halalkalibacterium ligniniphilum]|uniref:metal-dependent hydrolase n=1 Tax=Halalkalibacterium ligniniphilum TaxID=1134413 RepID=UPI0003473AE0|nr:metal-dependent hydrolase [Halalkalibacterium ligniniphilum]